MKKETIIYQSKQGEIEFKGDIQKETLWASQAQIAGLLALKDRLSLNTLGIFFQPRS